MSAGRPGEPDFGGGYRSASHPVGLGCRFDGASVGTVQTAELLLKV